MMINEDRTMVDSPGKEECVLLVNTSFFSSNKMVAVDQKLNFLDRLCNLQILWPLINAHPHLRERL